MLPIEIVMDVTCFLKVHFGHFLAFSCINSSIYECLSIYEWMIRLELRIWEKNPRDVVFFYIWYQGVHICVTSLMMSTLMTWLNHQVFVFVRFLHWKVVISSFSILFFWKRATFWKSSPPLGGRVRFKFHSWTREYLLIHILLLFYYYFWLHLVFVAAHRLSLVAESGGHSSLRCEWASHCSDFSCCGAWVLSVQASVVVAHGLSSCGHRF